MPTRRTCLLNDSVHGVHKSHSEDSRGVGVEADGEDVTVHVVAAELSHQTVGHEISVGEGGHYRLQTAGVVQERGGWREKETLCGASKREREREVERKEIG